VRFTILVPQPSRLTIGDIDMTSSIARQIVLAARPKGRPQLTDFRLEKTAIPTPAFAQLLLETQYLSLDPYMRGRMDDRKSHATPLQLGDVMSGESVAKVLASNHPDYAEGDTFASPRELSPKTRSPHHAALRDQREWHVGIGVRLGARRLPALLLPQGRQSIRTTDEIRGIWPY
jgi:hypothetical protein